MTQKIPLCDLTGQYAHLRNEMMQFFDKICSESAFIKGKYVQLFEQNYLKCMGADYGAGCSNGTSALKLALEVYGVGAGDEVILPSHTFVATAEAVRHVGAIPVFADCKMTDYTICPESIKRMITHKTRAIIAVHIYGTPCDMDEITDICQAHNLLLFEDTAQAHLAQYRGKIVGNFGHGASFSFYPGKNLGAYGDAGFVLVKDATHHETLKRLIDHGRLAKYDHEINGYNERMDAMQAGILNIKLPHLTAWTTARQAIAGQYDRAFAGDDRIGLMQIANHKQAVYHVYCVRVKNRDKVIQALNDNNIAYGIHYPDPVHVMPPFRGFTRDNMVNTEAISAQILSLPIYPEMPDHFVERVIKTMKGVI